MEYALAYVLAVAVFFAAPLLPGVFALVLLTVGPVYGWIMARGKGLEDHSRLDYLLKYFLFFFSGVGGLYAAVGHLFLGSLVAWSIGWEPSPFQVEVGMANLGYGMAGLLAPFLGPGYWLGLALPHSVFLLGAAYGHLVQAQAGNLASGNFGPVLVADIVGPLVMLGLLATRHWRQARGREAGNRLMEAGDCGRGGASVSS